MAFLPEEFGRPQEEPRAHLPADHVGPLVDQDRQIAVRLDPFAVHVADDRLGRGTNNQRLVQLLAAAVRHHGQLRRKALDVLRLPLEKAHRDEQREVGVDMAGLLEAAVERGLDILPQRVAVGPDDHTPFHRRVVREFGLLHDIGIPF